MSAFHGFYYEHKEAGVMGLELGPGAQQVMARIWATPFVVLPHEVYWTRLARYLMTHAPQGYVAWQGASHWLIGNCGNILSGAQVPGVNVVRFNRDRTFSYLWFAGDGDDADDDAGDDADDEADGSAILRLVFAPWDWRLEGAGDEVMFALDEAQVRILNDNLGWTGEVHEELERTWPSATHWR